MQKAAEKAAQVIQERATGYKKGDSVNSIKLAN
jgi:hypothetical protein